MLDEYLKVVNDLTINDEHRLKKENSELKDQKEYDRILIEKQMKDLNEQNQLLTSKVEEYEELRMKLHELDNTMEEAVATIRKQREQEQKNNRDYENETDWHKKSELHDNFLESQRQTIKKKSQLEKTVQESIKKKTK